MKDKQSGAAKKRRRSKKRNALGVAPGAKVLTLKPQGYHGPLRRQAWHGSFLQGTLGPSNDRAVGATIPVSEHDQTKFEVAPFEHGLASGGLDCADQVDHMRVARQVCSKAAGAPAIWRWQKSKAVARYSGNITSRPRRLR